jgi:hypothetical protein
MHTYRALSGGLCNIHNLVSSLLAQAGADIQPSKVYLVLYHFNQLDGHMSQAPVFCLKLALVTPRPMSGPVCDKLLKREYGPKTSLLTTFSPLLHMWILTATAKLISSSNNPFWAIQCLSV